MSRTAPALGPTAVLTAVLTALGTLAVPTVLAAPPPAAGAPDPRPASAPAAARAVTHAVEVSGDDVATYPAFDPGTSRYAVTTGPGTDGTLTVATTTSDPAAVVTVDGAPTTGGVRTVTGLEPGDEVAVLVDDAGGHAAYSFVYLPEGFPALERVTPDDAAHAPTHEHVMLTLGLWTAPSPFFETAVDANGVPAVVLTNRTGSSMDLKRQPNGHYSVTRGVGDDVNPAYPDSEVVELDERFREVGRHRATGLQHTDGHDALLLEDGSRWFLSYEPDAGTGRLDAVVQHAAADGEVLFEWSSAGHLDDTVAGADADYAHVNSLDLTADGHLLLSFRHFSSLFKVALADGTRADGTAYAAGDVIWKLGGRESDFDFLAADGTPSEDPGPCAQHTATELPNGHVLVFDNGAASWTRPLCVDQEDPGGAPVQHVPTRIAEWALDEEAGTARLVRADEVNGRHAIFAGSVQPLADDHVMVGWASSVEAIASELDAAGEVVWELRDPAVLPPGGNPNTRYFTYRAFAADVPDATPPEVSLPPLPGGAVYVEGEAVRPAYGCTDRGGSSLQTCTATPVDTSTPGTRAVVVRATDGDGNQATARRWYRVEHRHRADATVRAVGAPRTVGLDRYGVRPPQQVALVSRGARRPLAVVVRVRNTGRVEDRFTLRVSGRSRAYAVRLLGPRRSDPVGAGRAWTTRLQVTPRASAGPGDAVRVRLVASSAARPDRRDTVWVAVRRR